MSEQNETINKEIIKRNQTNYGDEITITEMKNLLGKSQWKTEVRFEQAEDRIRKTEDRTIEIMHTKK